MGFKDAAIVRVITIATIYFIDFRRYVAITFRSNVNVITLKLPP